jgi:hypothetical protein
MRSPGTYKPGRIGSAWTAPSCCVTRSVDNLHRLASEDDARVWEQQPLDEGERALTDVADWGPAEDWSDWTDAAR